MTKRVRIIGSGIYGANGEIPVRAEFDINGDLPAGWQGRAEIVSGGPKVGSAAITNLEPGPLDGSVDKLTAHIATMTDADEVQKLIDAETAGKSRKGALEVLEARRDELLA